MKNNKQWVQLFTIESRKYDLINCYGRILICSKVNDRKPYLLEIGGRNDDQIVTKMKIADT